MKLDTELFKFLKGEKFSNSLVIDIDREKFPSISREDFITSVISGCDVIHLGCSDHVGIINEKIKANKWLHKLITDNSKSCLGIDIDPASIDYLKNILGYTNVRQGDVTKDSFPEITAKEWDYVVFGELIEHLNNPVEFLESFKNRFGRNIKKFIITVPSVYTKGQTKNIMKYREVINSDHRFWFTPYTISKILSAAGYSPETISFANMYPLGTPGLIWRKLKRMFMLKEKYPYYCFSTIVVTGNI
jgi:hypothetical protein